MRQVFLVIVLLILPGMGCRAGSPDSIRGHVQGVHDVISFNQAVVELATANSDAEVEATLLDLLASDTAFGHGEEKRVWLIRMILQTPLSEPRFTPFSEPVQEALLKGLLAENPVSQADILSFSNIRRFACDYHDEVCAIGWQLLLSPSHSVVIGALRALFWLSEPDPMARDILRPYIVDPEHSVDPAVIAERERYARLDAWQAIRSGAATALLKTSVDLSAELDWLMERNGYAAFAAREALLVCAAPDGRFETADPRVQQQWINALLGITRSTIDQHPVSQDEFSVLVSIGQRFPQFRQAIGDFFEERVAESVQSRQRDEMRQILDRWATTP